MKLCTMRLQESSLLDEHTFSKTMIDLYMSFFTINGYFSTLHQNIQKLVTVYPFTDEFAHLKKSIAPETYAALERDEETSPEESNDICFH